jgi:phosphoribosyl-ATP pyrophosphohydrolase/phosphoribosyl-AMP cyclohydrolase
MLGYVNAEALTQTLQSGKVTFYSRSKQRLWVKGETSGHFLLAKSLHADCDKDTLLILAEPLGPTCHTGSQSCFGDASAPPLAFLATLEAVIAKRERERPAGSYTTALFEGELRRIAQKVGEEGVETALAAVAQDAAALGSESADLIFHLLVLLRARGVDLADVIATLANRHRTT